MNFEIPKEELLQQVELSYTKKQLLDMLCTEDQILHYLEGRGLRSFLLKIDSADLREATLIKQQQGDQDARLNRNFMKKNVLNFTVDELVRLNWRQRLIKFEQFHSHFNRKPSKGLKMAGFKLDDHLELGTNLVTNCSEQYQIGQKSSHYNHSKQIQIMYGLRQAYENEENESDAQQMNSHNIPQSQNSEFIDDRDQVSVHDDQLEAAEHELRRKTNKKFRMSRKMRQKQKQKMQRQQEMSYISDYDNDKQNQSVYENQLDPQFYQIEESPSDKNRKAQVARTIDNIGNKQLYNQYHQKKDENQQTVKKKRKCVIDSDDQ